MSQRTWLHQPMMKDARMLNLSLRALNLKHQAWRCLLASQALQQHRCCLAGYETLKIPAKDGSASPSSPYIVGANIPVRVPPTTLSTPIPAYPDQRSSVRRPLSHSRTVEPQTRLPRTTLPARTVGSLPHWAPAGNCRQRTAYTLHCQSWPPSTPHCMGPGL